MKYERMAGERERKKKPIKLTDVKVISPYTNEPNALTPTQQQRCALRWLRMAMPMAAVHETNGKNSPATARQRQKMFRC